MGFLRFILAITVILAHNGALFGFTFVGGLAAVQIFFMISGFYMTMVLNMKYIGSGSYKIFIVNRILRLYPAYLITMLLTIIVSILSYIIFGEWMRLDIWITNISIVDIQTYLILIL